MHTRESFRLSDYDYSQPGMYFVTICAKDRECLFGTITVGVGSPDPETSKGGETPPLLRRTLGQIVAYFKYQSSKQINESRNMPCVPIWQRNYYDHVIRDEHDINRIRQYISENPAKWNEDEYNK